MSPTGSPAGTDGVTGAVVYEEASHEVCVHAKGGGHRSASRPRADALRNRERIVSAARELFVEFGPSVPLDDVARRAGVGNATLYRHFPDRDALVHGVVVAVLSRSTAKAEEAAGRASDPFDAVRRFADNAVEEKIGALCLMLPGTFDHDHPELIAGRQRLEDAVAELVRRAQDAGRMRPDVGVGDFMVGLSQLTRPLPGTGCTHFDRFVHRHVQIFVDGLEAPARSELPGSTVTLEALRGECARTDG
ncbi:TetR/AcrR family transcriptional regulator [Streptomyces clavuligerus]|uniref:TetR family transcriptional regulator n=1 Tax=Streptomyces clavuligerus TaxID=1901 RepID=E2Q7K7_STRCL|nr:TetR/AcrR family transcriptional regulator [Streptomyces clavuligerus]ANW19743.1 TetR family transcriptional regulator [Streptomyces clavuligerus]AXU14357.1 TetR/AcrR family transcriptional regulator [Streptomyces clavuligerus]EFG07413.1 TetR family transcriptional regulator [Streptomyces clavuligerus]MBY6304360.1 TetR/AcrR family transcriptional regulator [Streptomyces clavuligerus]QCS07131.1 TetR/AcrR family transcriptional regulator [Streptomyces clavuligerus]